ncbi:MAG TPA: hypothetical protein VF930_07720 [Stellaceae bacterium]
MPASSDRRRAALRFYRLFPLLLLAPMAACSALSPLKAVRATPDELAFEYADDRAGDAARQASLYCANLGRSASLRQVTREAGAVSLAVFDCR